MKPEIINLFGLKIELVGFQGGIIIALMMGYVVAKLDIFFSKKIPDVIKLLVAPLLTVFISTVLLFTVIGPVGRILSNGITGAMVWGTNHLGAVGYALFAGIQQLVVITGLHHIIGAVEAQLIADTGTNFINPLMSVALMGQGGAVLGYLAVNWKNLKARELCIPSFLSTLFGISEPAIFGVNLRYRYPLIGGCIGGAVAGAYVYFSKLTAFGFGTTAVPGIAIANPANHGYLNYIVAHLIALSIGAICTIVFGKIGADRQQITPAKEMTEEQEVPVNQTQEEITLKLPVKGEVFPITESSDQTFSKKILGNGVVVKPSDDLVKVTAPCNGKIGFVYPGGHALGLELEDGTGILIHCGVDTVNLNGEGFSIRTEEGKSVKAGDILLEFDKSFIEKKGYSSEVIMLVSEKKEENKIKVEGIEDYTL